MEHRSLHHHSPSIRRYLNETDFNLYARILAAKETEREKFYVDSHKEQLRNVRHNVSRRELSEANQYPFLCVFHFAGCDHKFTNKRDWKDHVVCQHLRLDRVFWECAEGPCEDLVDALKQCASLNATDQVELSSPGGHFANSHDFRTHLLRHHRPTKTHDTDKDIKWVLDKEVQWLVDRQDSSMRMKCGLPQRLGCPMPQCASVRFTGPTAWDQRLNHAAEHFLTNPQCPDAFGGERDNELLYWATCNAVSILEETPNACLQQHDCNKSVADSGYSSMPGMPRHPTMSQQGDSAPAVPRKIPEWKSNATFYDPGTEELYYCRASVGLGAWAQDNGYPATLFEEETIPSSAYQSFKEMFSHSESIGDYHTLDTSQDSGSGDESDETPHHNPEAAVVMQWFHGWLQQWLAPLTQERPNGIGGRPSTASQSQNSTSTSGSGTQKKKGTSRPRRLPKRKRASDDDDEGNEESSKSQRIDGDTEVRMFACPYFKRNPRKYGQPKWKSCAHPGYRDIHRVKEHMYRRHSLPEYQCRRCRVDLKTSDALEAHLQQQRACTPSIGAQDGLSQDQVKRMRSKKGTGKNKDEVERWNDVYAIAFPHDQDTPSPYLYDTDDDRNARELDFRHEYSRFLTRELPLLVEGYLNTVGCPLPETIQDDIEQLVKRLVPQSQSSFLEEMGLTRDNNEQPDNASATNDGAGFVESTTTRLTSEDSATMVQQNSTYGYPTKLQKGSTSQEAISMFPTSDDPKGLTTMPQVGYDTADSTMFQDGNFSGQGMMLPAYCPPTNQDWQTVYSLLGYNPFGV
ncbi:uncharacterized protein FTJAE_11690 [Fusarium tjaetaba]|uniref:C2H2-type domain-containing protein n=1 Tax=Fusarium tjaetaba TaxID=1567544 RepID=A0A8H5QTK4_9HYPO|nr:uncharacterized protein FTJAE_11690 [Fusarium tjaetaba]KAF5620333.1 hypothetical protein FTJAE_11690 [Fusarium tjaetaba]